MCTILNIKALILMLLIIFTVLSFNTAYVSAEDNIITVYYDKDIGEVNNKILGSNLLGLDPIKQVWPQYYYKQADYGTGIWNPKRNESFSGAIELARNAGLSVVRFATGNYFKWKQAIGNKRKHFLYGIDEFMKTMREIGAEPDFTLSYYAGDEQDAANLVEYLNAPHDGKHPWAGERAKNGHSEPYGVRYFELGNEVFVSTKEGDKEVQPEEYAAKYLAYRKAMKSIDPSVQLGLVLHHYDWRWDRKILEITGSNVDFVVRHIYPPKDLSYWTSDDDYKTEDLFKVILGSIVFYTDKQFGDMQKVIKEITGRDYIYHAITEYNIGLQQYRYSLGSSLVTAELMRIFMKPQNRVFMANHWDFIEDYWGMIKLTEDYTKQERIALASYVKRPSYYVYELYNKHFGDVLLDTDIKVETYDISQYKPYMKAYINNMTNRTLIEYEWLNNEWIDKVKRSVMRGLSAVKGNDGTSEENLLTGEWDIRTVPGVITENNDGILNITFKEPNGYNYYHSVKQAFIEPNTYYKLSGYIKSENLIDKKGVSLEIEDGRGWLETHSAAHTTEIKGSVDWQYVEVIYKTLPDAKSVNVRARRASIEGPLEGNAYFKDVKLQKYILNETLIPYLSVNASKNKKGDKVYLMVINKNMNEAITTSVDIKGFVTPGGDKERESFRVNAWILNGPSVDSTNEVKAENIRVINKQLEVNNTSFKFIFEPHSLTAIEIVKKL